MDGGGAGQGGGIEILGVFSPLCGRRPVRNTTSLRPPTRVLLVHIPSLLPAPRVESGRGRLSQGSDLGGVVRLPLQNQPTTQIETTTSYYSEKR